MHYLLREARDWVCMIFFFEVPAESRTGLKKHRVNMRRGAVCRERDSVCPFCFFLAPFFFFLFLRLGRDDDDDDA